MRRRLVLVFVAVSTMVALAFVVPLAFLVRNTAQDRAIDVARADAAAVVPALVSGATRAQLESAVALTESGREDRMTLVTAAGWIVGPEVEASGRLRAALETGVSDIGDVPGGVEVVAAVASGSDELSAVRVFVPSSRLREGQWRAWTALGVVAAILIGISVLVADRLARAVVRPTQRLVAAARRLGAGDLEVRVEPDGPGELVELAGSFNDLGSRVSAMLVRERELVAELSHRLRTPLTKLRMRIDQVSDAELADQLRGDVDDVTAGVNDLIVEARSSVSREVTGCDAAAVVAARVAFWSILAEDQRRPWRFESPDAPARVAVPEGALAAAIDVLIENVFAHTADATALTIGCHRVGGDVRIRVADAGDGIDMSVRGRGESGASSTGLGLDIARRTAEAANGSLEIGPSELGGSEVTLSLPFVADGTAE
ncbi:MAG: HAMP domain-containing protein [Acidimicrobiales bacterium]